MAFNAKFHPNDKVRGTRDPKTSKKQAGGRLVFILNGQPMFWNDRPHKFAGHIRRYIKFYERNGRALEITDIKWKQLGSETWWRIPEWPDGIFPANE